MIENTSSKVVLAYSGGLDTSVILKWLQEQYQCEVVTFTADIGQGEEVESARAKAEALGIKEIYIDDLTEEFVSDFVYPMFRANTIYSTGRGVLRSCSILRRRSSTSTKVSARPARTSRTRLCPRRTTTARRASGS